MTHAELIAALEAATEPSRELDEAIAVWRYNVKRGPGAPMAKWMAFPAAYTASIDAALTLVPVNYDRLVCCVNGKWQATCGPENSFQDVGDQKGATPAIALCIAALKARKETT